MNLNKRNFERFLSCLSCDGRTCLALTIVCTISLYPKSLVKC